MKDFPRPCLRRPGELGAHVEDPAAVSRPGVKKSLLPTHTLMLSATLTIEPKSRCSASAIIAADVGRSLCLVTAPVS